MDFLFESIGDLVLEPLVMAFWELWGGTESFESRSRVQTLFGDDVWWNS
jgi:hypothetical protein